MAKAMSAVVIIAVIYYLITFINPLYLLIVSQVFSFCGGRSIFGYLMLSVPCRRYLSALKGPRVYDHSVWTSHYPLSERWL